jgi:murein DD-endopeptidase MepM/ murein hydrolase activator NlpD
VRLIVAALLHLVATDAITQPVPAKLLAPVAHACISSPFGVRRPPGPHAIGFHNGIDLPAPAGGAVLAAADGRIVGIHRRGPGGLEVVVQHGDARSGFMTIYGHLGSVAPALASGRTRVAAGERIGVVGHSGVTYGMHLFFEVLVGGRPVDPNPYLGLSACK